MEDKQINTHNLKVDFGEHKGKLWTQVEVSYLQWCINKIEPDHRWHQIARAELARRGTAASREISISNHAIDRASIRVLERWQNDRNEDEGLYSWLVRVCGEALDKSAKVRKTARPSHIIYKGCEFVFEYGNYRPTLTTVLEKCKI